jgi:hypothetical protein
LGDGVKVQVLAPEEVREHFARFHAARTDSRMMRNDWELAEQAERGTALFFWRDGASFNWLCPGCGSWHDGQIGDQPVSGWDNPRWVNSGTPERPTLAPSLGCGGWKHGTCPEGHYWLRDGELVKA